MKEVLIGSEVVLYMLCVQTQLHLIEKYFCKYSNTYSYSIVTFNICTNSTNVYAYCVYIYKQYASINQMCRNYRVQPCQQILYIYIYIYIKAMLLFILLHFYWIRNILEVKFLQILGLLHIKYCRSSVLDESFYHIYAYLGYFSNVNSNFTIVIRFSESISINET